MYKMKEHTNLMKYDVEYEQITSLRDAKENLNSEDGAQSSQLRTLREQNARLSDATSPA